MSRWKICSEGTPSTSTILSGIAFRTGSVFSSQLGLRTQVPLLFASNVPSCKYGPLENTSNSDLSPLSLSLRTGEYAARDAAAWLKSAHGFLK